MQTGDTKAPDHGLLVDASKGKTSVGILLAAGKSRRFGDQDKLLQHLDGRPLCLHAGDAMRKAGLSRCLAVVSHDDVEKLLTGFEILRCSGNQSDSLKAGVQAASALGADQIVICLADMPFVTTAMITELLHLARTYPTCASIEAGRISPPAVFPKDRFKELLTLDGDRGAHTLFQSLPNEAFLDAKTGALADLNTIDDFRNLAND